MSFVKDSQSDGGKRRRAAIGSNEKGRKFEKMIAGLYKMLGAEVVQNIEVCQKKIDLLATFQIHGSRIKHRVLVECKDEKRVRNANQRVMQFRGLLDVARRAGEADSAEIVSRLPWGDEAKGFAKQAGISLLTHAEKPSFPPSAPKGPKLLIVLRSYKPENLRGSAVSFSYPSSMQFNARSGRMVENLHQDTAATRSTRRFG
jgi:hypothetical protein